MKRSTCLLTTIVVVASACTAKSEIRFANIFADHMVLQQQEPQRIWGWATPGSNVTVTLTESEEDAVSAAGIAALSRTAVSTEKEDSAHPIVHIEYVQEDAAPFETVAISTTAGPDGQWDVRLKSLAASFRPKYLCASDGDQSIACADVLVGEVWVTAGQSNMAWSGDRTGWIDKQGLLLPGVRYAHTGRGSSYKPLADLAEPVEWLPCTDPHASGLSTIPYLFGKLLHAQLQIPVGIINAASGGAHGNFWCSLEEMHAIDFWTVKQMVAEHDQAVAEWEDETSRKRILETYEQNFTMQYAEWELKATAAESKGERAPPKPKYAPPASPQCRHKISCLFNARIAPIGRLAVRGVLFLQGEQQVLTWCGTRYQYVFPRIISSFRSVLHDPELPFGIITLQGPGHNQMPISEIGACNRTAVIREIHYKTHLDTPGTGFIVAHDVGRGLHPAWKRPIAERAVHWALRDVYETIPDQSYRLERVEFEEGRAFVHIVQRGERRIKVKGEQKTEVIEKPVKFATWSGNDSHYLSGFLIAGEDRRWRPAKVEPNSERTALEVWSDLVDHPVALRYGWAGYPIANIGPWENPLPPFRTDDWPLPESLSITPELKERCRSDWYATLDQSYADSLDRTIRQGSLDAAKSEMLLYGNATEMLKSKAARIQAILNELDPELYQSEGFQKLDYTDWTIRRCNEARLSKAAKVAEEIEILAKDKALQEVIGKLRKAANELESVTPAKQ